MKTLTDRIAYYTRKARQYSALHRRTARYKRLIAYKAAIERIYRKGART